MTKTNSWDLKEMLSISTLNKLNSLVKATKRATWKTTHLFAILRQYLFRSTIRPSNKLPPGVISSNYSPKETSSIWSGFHKPPGWSCLLPCSPLSSVSFFSTMCRATTLVSKTETVRSSSSPCRWVSTPSKMSFWSSLTSDLFSSEKLITTCIPSAPTSGPRSSLSSPQVFSRQQFSDQSATTSLASTPCFGTNSQSSVSSTYRPNLYLFSAYTLPYL